jgi:hypothetical protein
MKLIAAALPVVLAGCCPVPPGGPTATGVMQRMNLVDGAPHFFDVDVPAETTQLNVDLLLERTDVTLRVRQIEPSCMPELNDTCVTIHTAEIGPRPAGVTRFSTGLRVHKPRTRIVVDTTSTVSVTVDMTVTPWRAGCT